MDNREAIKGLKTPKKLHGIWFYDPEVIAHVITMLERVEKLDSFFRKKFPRAVNVRGLVLRYLDTGEEF